MKKNKLSYLISAFSAALALASGHAVQAADDASDLFLQRIYPNGGTSLYCQKHFDAGDRMKVDFVYSEKDLLRHFNCITSRQCDKKPGYSAIASDMHNLYPVQRAVELDRRGSLFGELPDNIEPSPCGYVLSFQTFYPTKPSRGNVARAMVYMHVKHGLPLVGHLEMYQRWSAEDPPDAEEKERNRLIAKEQGNSNPYIDDPASINKVTVSANRPR